MNIPNSNMRLLSFVQRIERLNDEKKEIQDQIKSVKAEAKSAGFDPKVIAQMIKERDMTDAARQEWNALCEMYRAALGMLDGTPLGDAARKRMEGRDHEDDERDPDTPDMFDEADASEPAQPQRTLPDEARRMGADAFHAGRRVTDNPFGASDPARAAWDEGFCAESGSDGMDIPPAWRRSPPKKEKAEDAGG
ncbi:DUF2312 domain-containing protein [Acidomonas methanolica]|uniref:GapR-like DNA-binding domain-containing protein n=1 Tax=Acidomonas methanolica NBRC 104435 TaxID=1231351 RepID=A0A023D7N0_ACIMT|nr:DUF2312 domain-containing protein [Acidomonas methanolica]TCS24131.1 uncharacterized protein (UPF0335 family) [Acidomonas methanolica]GAJ29715.1 hypothetical protein Amme_076_008 [Acidomonas methanolica NBRC 104435]GBQ59509.1 hypothetical protein AA0498_2772 [Acidomonas methanolica]GEL00047.1 hypothetical protein AME01nite_25450 [Acidomonas methanolica NBRC 104435]